MKTVTLAACLLPLILGAGVWAGSRPASTGVPATWDSKSAAAYLDQRMVWWAGWKPAARDHGTFCVSCHTTVPYALARPALREALGEQTPSAPELELLANVTKRVRMWSEVAPAYAHDPSKVAESRGTESVLNAAILVSYDVPVRKLGPDTRTALDNMWGEQIQSGAARGAWPWLQFHNSPWEGDSQYYGAVLAALAVGRAPGHYQSAPGIRGHMKLLRSYLVRERQAQKLIDRVMLLDASTEVSGLLTKAQQRAIADEALSRQRADGGFSLSSFVGDWKRHDGTPLETKSDGYATGVVALTLQQAGMRADRPQLQRALAWLRQNQERSDGRWLAYSLNKQRDLATDIGRFMSDAATAYAVLALEQAQR